MSHLLAVGIGAGGAFLAQHVVRCVKGSKGPAGDGDVQERSTTSSAGGGAAAYETTKAVDEYLLFHFGAQQDILPYSNGPKEALNFTERLGALCERHCATLRDFTGEGPEPIALDVGCAVGGASFELARSFPHVLGIDYSKHFVDAAERMRAEGSAQYQLSVEGDVRRTCTASVPADIDRNRVKFMVGDACDLPANLAAFDCVLAANLLCRLPEPLAFLNRCRTLIKPGGILVLVSPYSWLKGWTDKSKWLGGYYKEGKPVLTADTIKSVLSPDFDQVAATDVPFLIREHARKFQWGISHAVVWVRKAA